MNLRLTQIIMLVISVCISTSFHRHWCGHSALRCARQHKVFLLFQPKVALTGWDDSFKNRVPI